jgi:hypothetical protein
MLPGSLLLGVEVHRCSLGQRYGLTIDGDLKCDGTFFRLDG